MVNLNGLKLGIVGYTLTELPTLIFPGYLDPFVVTDPVNAVNRQIRTLRFQKGANAIFVAGHIGADPTSSTVTSPNDPLLGFTKSLVGADAVLGGHTHYQTIGAAPNGTLIVENVNAGTRFTRVRLVVDTNARTVIYKTADWHKPWNIGVTADPAIQAEIDALNAQLAPILSTVIGESSRYIPRADACGQSAGRTCESLIGDLATDAMRLTYSTDFAITNAGGLRADLTCPTTDIAGDFCPAYTPPPYLDHARPGAVGAALRQCGGHVQHQRRRAQNLPGERRLEDASGGWALPADLRPVLHLRHLGAGW